MKWKNTNQHQVSDNPLHCALSVQPGVAGKARVPPAPTSPPIGELHTCMLPGIARGLKQSEL